MREINRLLIEVMKPSVDSKLVKVIFAGKRKKSQECSKVTVRPVMIRGEYMYQAEFHTENKVTHRNISCYEGVDFATGLIAGEFKQVNILTEDEDIQILASKPEKPRITRKPASRNAALLSHNRKKNYIIDEGKPCDFLIELGVMSEEGKVFKNHYGKFRQINRFLEIVEDSVEELLRSRDRGLVPEPEKCGAVSAKPVAELHVDASPAKPIKVIDFGCGKSYLTFALYHYLKIIRGYNVEIIGLDLKEDVIRFCNEKARKLRYDGLKFQIGDIALYESDGADMVVTLHACDTATDYALTNAVKWNSKVILSVPCCQHELFSQITEPVGDTMLKHGILKDKFTEILTDGLRGLKLESCGYDVDMIEFTSLEHTSKNVMIRAVAGSEKKKRASQEYEALKNMYGVSPTTDLIG